MSVAKQKESPVTDIHPRVISPTEPEAGDRAAISPPRGPLRRFVNRLEVDRATFYSLCYRIWQFLAGPISILMIGTFFSPQVQGYYYTFASLIALQSFFELGLYIVIINVSSHEWSHLKLDEARQIHGDAAALSRLSSLARWLLKWYSVAGVLFAIGVGAGGGWFLYRKDTGVIDWEAPWLTLVVCSAVVFWQLPFTVLLEGCGQMPVVNRYRLYQVVTANWAVWTAMALGAGLWCAVVAAVAQLAWNFALFLGPYRGFFRELCKPHLGPTLDWTIDIWPMQWRLAISGVLSYFAFQLFVPVMFNYHGSAVAGQMGMTLQLAMVLQAVALAWVQTRAPLFGQLIAKRDFRELDRVYFRLTKVSLSVVLLGGGAIWSLVWGLHWSQLKLANRLLDPLPTALLLLAIACYHVPHCQALYIRAHKRDPLFVLSIVASILLGLSVWWFGSRVGPLGATAAYLTVVAIIVLPAQTFIWWNCRKTH